MKIGITGANGKLGKLVVENLKKKVSPTDIVALVRNPEKARDLEVEVRKFDYDNVDGGSLRGIETLLLISSSEVGKRLEQHKNVIAAAKNAGVKRIVYTSLLHANTSTLPLAPEHIATEKEIVASGIPYTILRNGWYTENYTDAIAGALSIGAYVGSAENGKISSATREDYALAAVAVLTTAGHHNAIYELAGDVSFTLDELVKEVSLQTGKSLVYQNVSQEEYARILANIGLPEGLAEALAMCDFEASKGVLWSDSQDLSQLIGRKTTPLSGVIKTTLTR